MEKPNRQQVEETTNKALTDLFKNISKRNQLDNSGSEEETFNKIAERNNAIQSLIELAETNQIEETDLDLLLADYVLNLRSALLSSEDIRELLKRFGYQADDMVGDDFLDPFNDTIDLYIEEENKKGIEYQIEFLASQLGVETVRADLNDLVE